MTDFGTKSQTSIAYNTIERKMLGFSLKKALFWDPLPFLITSPASFGLYSVLRHCEKSYFHSNFEVVTMKWIELWYWSTNQKHAIDEWQWDNWKKIVWAPILWTILIPRLWNSHRTGQGSCDWKTKHNLDLVALTLPKATTSHKQDFLSQVEFSRPWLCGGVVANIRLFFKESLSIPSRIVYHWAMNQKRKENW